MIAIQCSRLFDGETFSAGAATVLIEENRIVAVESGFPTLREQWEVVRYSGATVLPGLIDTHVHLVGDSRPGNSTGCPGSAMTRSIGSSPKAWSASWPRASPRSVT